MHERIERRNDGWERNDYKRIGYNRCGCGRIDIEGRMQEQFFNTNAERSDLEDRCLDLYRSLLLAVPVRCEAQKLSTGELKQKEAIRGGKMLCQWLV